MLTHSNVVIVCRCEGGCYEIMSWYQNGVRAAAVGVALVIAWCGSAYAQQLLTTVEIDERCNITFAIPYGGEATGSCHLVSDGVRPNVVTYELPGEAFNTLGPLVVGDLVLTDAGGAVSDIIRFLPPFLGSQLVFFYSDNTEGVDALADVGLPSDLQANHLTVSEVGPEGINGFNYVPSEGQPGYGFANPSPGSCQLVCPFSLVTYTIHSDSVPEPATLALLGVGLAGLGFARRRKRS